MPKPPTTTSKTAAFLARAIDFSGKSQAEIARDAGVNPGDKLDSGIGRIV